MKRPNPVVVVFAVATAAFVGSLSFTVEGQSVTNAPAAFDNQTNGHISQAEFDDALAEFVQQEGPDGGLGPVYNAQSCGECHQNPVSGGPTQISELRAGHLSNGNFVDAPGGSLINDRATNANIQERVPGAENVRTFRITLSTLGDGFVEAVNSNTLVAIANAQPGQSGGQIAGQVIQVPVLEAPGNVRVGRFGWKNQHASLLSFSSDAYLNEMGITNRFNLVENTSLGTFVGFGSGFDPLPDNTACTSGSGTCGEDPDEDINAFTDFMRATKAPPRGPISADANTGQTIFTNIGCGICHTASIQTSPPGTVINGGALVVSAALGNKIIRPFGDFLLHDIGTGDGIVQNGGQSTRNKVRTMPLWGTRTHSRHMHDGESLTFNESILRHAGEATGVINNYRALSLTQQNQLITFLQSL